MQRSIDFNCDVGESFGAWRMGDDAALLKFASSANIACGLHAGDPVVIQQTVALCQQQGVAIGAHPGLPDLQGFGRRTMALSDNEIYALVLYQIGALAGFVRAAGGELRHVKPHGALYHMANACLRTAEAVSDAVRAFSPHLKLYALAHAGLAETARLRGLHVIDEAFAERRYEADGSLTPRSHPDAEIHDVASATQQVVQLLTAGAVTARTGERLPMTARSICLHGDRPNTVAFAGSLRAAIEGAGWRVAPP